jgi:hypothetical protein
VRERAALSHWHLALSLPLFPVCRRWSSPTLFAANEVAESTWKWEVQVTGYRPQVTGEEFGQVSRQSNPFGLPRSPQPPENHVVPTSETPLQPAPIAAILACRIRNVQCSLCNRYFAHSGLRRSFAPPTSSAADSKFICQRSLGNNRPAPWTQKHPPVCVRDLGPRPVGREPLRHN